MTDFGIEWSNTGWLAGKPTSHPTKLVKYQLKEAFLSKFEVFIPSFFFLSFRPVDKA